jgi:hypothetical protein
MNKQTKTLSIVAVVGVGAYLIWKQMQPKATTTTTTSFSGGVMGNRQRGLVGIENGGAKNSNWIRPKLNRRKLKMTGGVMSNRKRLITGVAENMTPKNSNWIRPELNGQKLKLTGVNENARVIASPFSWK